MPNNHPSFDMPDEDTKIWRYIDFTKFVSLLERNALFFSTISIFRKTDKHEGTYNQATIESHLKETNHPIREIVGTGLIDDFARMVIANCWHMNDIESVAMWTVYLRNQPGVVIQSTAKSLIEALDSKADVISSKIESGPFIGKVHYVDEGDLIPEPEGLNGLDAVLWKRKSFQFEKELRVVAIARFEQLYRDNGIYVPVDLHQLIEKIVISPQAPAWFFELVFLIASKYELGDKVQSSRLDAQPGNIDKRRLQVEFTCPKCGSHQESEIDPFYVKDYGNRTRTVFSAVKVRTLCKNCDTLLEFSIEVSK